MKFKSSLYALLVLAALMSWVWWVERPAVEEKTKAEETSGKVFFFEVDNVKALTLERRSEDVPMRFVRIKKTSSQGLLAKWRVESPVTTDAETLRIESLLRSLSELERNKTLDGKDLDVYGLSDPEVRVLAELESGQSVELFIGKNTPIERGCYARTGDSNVVFTLGAFSKADFDNNLIHFRDKKPVRFNQALLRRMEIQTPKEHLMLAKVDGKWRIEAPFESPCDSDAVKDFVYAVEGLNASGVLSESATPEEIARYGLDTPWLDIQFWEKNAEAPVRFLLQRDGPVGRSLREHDNVLMEMDVPDWGKLEASAEVFRRRNLFTTPRWELKRIEIARGETLIVMAKKDWEWEMLAPKEGKVDGLKSGDLMAALAELEAESFVEKPGGDSDYGLDAPFLTLQAGNEDVNEKVLLGKMNGKIFARADNWPGVVMEVDEAALEMFMLPPDEYFTLVEGAEPVE